jgi:hypothetical protein
MAAMVRGALGPPACNWRVAQRGPCPRTLPFLTNVLRFCSAPPRRASQPRLSTQGEARGCGQSIIEAMPHGPGEPCAILGQTHQRAICCCCRNVSHARRAGPLRPPRHATTRWARDASSSLYWGARSSAGIGGRWYTATTADPLLPRDAGAAAARVNCLKLTPTTPLHTLTPSCCTPGCGPSQQPCRAGWRQGAQGSLGRHGRGQRRL